MHVHSLFVLVELFDLFVELAGICSVTLHLGLGKASMPPWQLDTALAPCRI
jgi:hypothetical protein